ncbi:DegQ family serine endoprotease [Magnetospirillum sp. UT-4]|uniref:DegQ family serine endoprotease n=1 Tax=Magnetospirillum sp. UT-4 TaxID=2681467 RepID=UPI00137F6562|nr:DegQ family serine endoprotease [Magnetospirillum sp. UT-4]CAA7616758.1 putative serine protease (DegP periplasmic, membrane-associated serine endoprotease, protease Do), containing two PDZ domains [Magnetospirillum sp. UT-4]
MKHVRLFAVSGLMLILSAAALAQAVPDSRGQIGLSFAPVVRQTAPAVVNIYTRRVVKAAASPLLADPFFRRFFGDMVPHGMPQDRVQRSLGSGVVVAADGTVVTNHHVIKGADEVTVVLADRREFEARVVGSDERSDLAVLKVEPPRGETLPVLPMGDSDALEVGDLVIAIGNPFGVGQTVTSGIVSALARTNVGITDFRSFIQTDAAINPGNSGGALVDMGGRLIGINTAIYSKDGGSNGIGFAIPTSLVRSVLASITQTGRVVRPWLGASGQAVTGELAQALKLPRPVGILINGVHRDGPAAKAGLKVGDVVSAVNGREVDDPEGLRFRLATLAPGAEAILTVMRDGAEKRLTVRLTAPPETPPRDITEIGGPNPVSGATIANLSPALAEEIGADGTASGVVILRIRRGSVAHRLQLQPGDIILRINDRPVAAVADARRLLAGEARLWRVTISRDGETHTLQVGG